MRVYSINEVLWEKTMEIAIRVVFLTWLAAGLAACGDSSEPASPSETETAAPVVAETAPEPPPETSDRARSILSLEVDGVPRSFNHFPAGNNLTMSMSTMVLAQPSPDATEEFSIAVMGFDLSEAQLPISLELGMREAMESEDPSQFASAPKPLISYISPDGTDYSSYATVVFEQYRDGIVIGRIEDIELEPSEEDGPPIMLSNIRFEVAL